MKHLLLPLRVMLVGLAVSISTFAQVRPDIYLFNSADRALLASKMLDYITPQIIQYHCNFNPNSSLTTGPDIHSDFDFLPFHRLYLEGLEDYLLEQGLPQFVPLPYWDPSTCTPLEFQTAGPNNNGVDPDCIGLSCYNAGSGCSTPTNWCPTVALPSYLQLPGLCSWPFTPNAPVTQPNNNNNTTGLSYNIESPYHNNVHAHPTQGMNGVMASFKSPSVLIFWLWHAYVDDIWKTWECNCSGSTTNPIDLYMKDNHFLIESERDRGEEPDIDMGPMWLSEDIWVRITNDGYTNHVHENPEYYALPSNYDYVYVQVRNRGCVPSSGTEELHLHWAKAATALSYPNHWDGSMTTINNDPLGDLIATVTLPVIQPGDSYIAEIPWQPQDPSVYFGLFGVDPVFWADQPWHYCLLARVEAPGIDPITYTNGSAINEYVRQNNNVVWKNVTIVNANINNIVGQGNNGEVTTKLNGAIVAIGDLRGDGGTYEFELNVPPHYDGRLITDEAEVNICLDEKTWQKWEEGGFQAENVEITRPDLKQVTITAEKAVLKNMYFDPDERSYVFVGYNFLVDELSGVTEFAYELIQRTEDGELIGGEHFDVRRMDRPIFNADAGPDQDISSGEGVTLDATDIGEPAIYNWYDTDGSLAHTGQSWSPDPHNTSTYKLEVIALSDGAKDYDDVRVIVDGLMIVNITPNPASTEVMIEYECGSSESASIYITSAGGFSKEYPINPGTNQMYVDLQGYQTGAYNVILVCNGNPVDATSLIVQ